MDRNGFRASRGETASARDKDFRQLFAGKSGGRNVGTGDCRSVSDFDRRISAWRLERTGASGRFGGLRILLDENLPVKLAQQLRDLGHSVGTVKHHRKRSFSEELKLFVEKYGLKWQLEETVKTVG